MDQEALYISPDAQGDSPQPFSESMMINSDFRPLDIDQYYTSSPSLTPTQPRAPTHQIRSRIRSRKMTTSEEDSPHRKRIAVACNRCRKRKIRCSGENPSDPSLPCVNCMNAGHSPCLFLRPFSSETPMLGDRTTSRPATGSRPSQQRLIASIANSPSLIGGIGAINDDPHESVMKAEPGYHFGSAIRSTLPQVNNYPSEDGMFPVNPIPNYPGPDTFMLAYRPVQPTSYNQLAANNLQNPSRMATESMYFGNGGAVSSGQAHRPSALNLGVSYQMVRNADSSSINGTATMNDYPASNSMLLENPQGETLMQHDVPYPLNAGYSVVSAPSLLPMLQNTLNNSQESSASVRRTSAYTLQSNETYEPMSGSPDGLWHTRSGSSANSRSSGGSDFQYRYTDTTSYRASASYATPLPSNRAVVMAPAPQSNHSASSIEAPSVQGSPHRL